MTHDERVIKLRGFPEMETVEEVFKYASITTANWYSNGCFKAFPAYKLNRYETEHPYYELTDKEFDMLKELQAEEIRKAKKDYEEEKWVLLKTFDWGDYFQEMWVNKFGDMEMRTIIKDEK